MSEIQIPLSNVPGYTPPSQPNHVWPCWWGGAGSGANAPKISGLIRELRLSVGGVAAKKQAGGPQFPVKSAKDLATRLAQALIDLDMVAPVVAQEVTFSDVSAIPENKTASGKPVFRTLVHVKATVRIGAPDGSFIDVVGSGHGGDGEDKAGGKASTYAWKDAVLKGLTTPENDMIDTDDEAPAERPAKPTPPPAPTPLKATSPDSVSALDQLLLNVASADEEQLNALADGIKSGAIALAGAEKLKASVAFTQRRKVINAAKETAKE